MIKLADSTTVWVTSDTHFSHKNICRGTTNWRLQNGNIPLMETRDFQTIEKMNSAIVDNINDSVQQNDILIHLGDWSFGGFENIELFYDRLICKNIHLILGNHDHHIDLNRGNIRKLFLTVSWFDQFKYQGETIEACHYPMSSWNKLNKGRVHIHGHTHLPINKTISKGRRIDVGIDGHPEFRPYNLLHEILNPMKKIEINSELGSNDHHLNKINSYEH